LVIVGMLLSFGLALWMPTPERVAAPERGPAPSDGQYQAGQSVEIWQNERWLPGKIQAVGDGRYFVFYDGFSVSWNEWVTPARLRGVPSDSPAR
jgi:hypothetical protein